MALWCGIAVLGAALISLLTLRERAKPVTLTGVVIRQDSDPRKQEPIPGVEIAAAGGLALQGGKSDSSGLFHLNSAIWNQATPADYASFPASGLQATHSDRAGRRHAVCCPDVAHSSRCQCRAW